VQEAGPRQRCPNCGHNHDVSVYVTGQRLLCRCGLHFVVSRSDVRGATSSASAGGASAHLKRTSLAPEAPPAPTPLLPELGGAGAASVTKVARALRVPGYELLHLIGRGGMGEVWKAHQRSLGRAVAVKVLAPELAADPEFIKRFEKEAAALAALSHPGIVQIIDRGTCEPEGTFFFAMELCEGESLRDLIGRKLEPRRSVEILAQVARAIGYAHERGVVHRDLKPENVLVDAAGTAKVVDFGLAGLRQGPPELNLTRASVAMGTLHYMAPEQRRDARAADERADVFSLGVMLYECLTGEVPAGRFRPASERVPGLDRRLDKILGKALSQEPEARYPNAGAMAVEIESLRTLPPRAPEPEGARKAGPAGARIPRAAWLAGAAVLVALALRAVDRPGARVPSQDTDAPLRLEVAERADGARTELAVHFRFGTDVVLRAHSGTWGLEREVLLASVWGDKPRPDAVLERPLFLAEDLVLQAQVALEPPPQGTARGAACGRSIGLEPPAPGASEEAAGRAGLLFQGADGATLTLWAILGRGYEVAVKEAGGASERPVLVAAERAPAPGLPVALKLEVRGGSVEASAGAPGALEVVFRGRAPDSPRGRAAVACSEARCRFLSLSVSGRASPGP
jgi:hypothetical protein